MVGEPGVGKTRLCYEFTRSRHAQGWLVLESGSASYGQAALYLSVRDLLKSYFLLEDRDPARRVREKVTGKLLTLDPALGPTLPAFLTLLEVPMEDATWQALDPPQRRQRTLEALKRLFIRESQVQPLLLVFENLHWIDAESQALLDTLVDSLPTARILLLVNYRAEYRHGWGSKTYYTQVRLDPLPPASAEAMLQSLLGEDVGAQVAVPHVGARRAVPLQLKQLLIERTQGNPFFLEESVRTLVEQGVLVRNPDVGAGLKPAPTKSLTDIQVPATVQAVLARIDRLPQEEKQLLQTAAVIGTEVPLALLQAIAEAPEASLRLGLTHLQAAEFLYETRLFPEIEYTFKHALTQQVAYETLLQERQRVLHAHIVEALEALADSLRLGQVSRYLSTYFYLTGVYDQAIAASQRALMLATADGEVVLQALANLRLGIACGIQGDYRRAIDCLRQTIASLVGTRRREHFGNFILPAVFSRATSSGGMLRWVCLPRAGPSRKKGFR